MQWGELYRNGYWGLWVPGGTQIQCYYSTPVSFIPALL